MWQLTSLVLGICKCVIRSVTAVHWFALRFYSKPGAFALSYCQKHCTFFVHLQLKWLPVQFFRYTAVDLLRERARFANSSLPQISHYELYLRCVELLGVPSSRSMKQQHSCVLQTAMQQTAPWVSVLHLGHESTLEQNRKRIPAVAGLSQPQAIKHSTLTAGGKKACQQGHCAAASWHVELYACASLHGSHHSLYDVAAGCRQIPTLRSCSCA